MSKGSNGNAADCTNAPAVSCVMPCRNEAGFVREAVTSVLAQHEPVGGIELIVVDGLSDDGTREILAELRAGDARLRVVDNAARITPVAMNLGIQAARGHYIAILGSHNRYDQGYLEAACRFLDSRPDVDNVGGSMFLEGNGLVQRAIAAAFDSPLASGGARWHDADYEGPADTVFGGVYRRDVFDRIGYFDETLVRNQDDELNFRLTRSGGKIWQVRSMRSWYRPRGSLGALFRQYEQYGYWKVRVITKNRRPASLRHLVPGGFVATLAALAVASPFSGVAAASLAVMVGLYFAVVVSGAVLAAVRSSWDLFCILPAVFLCQHFGYGIGFLKGVADVVRRRKAAGQRYQELTRADGTGPKT